MSENSENSVETECSNTTQKGEISSGPQKICGVCGDRALGFNFNAISCESCKAFFRRNAVASKTLKCPFSNECNITVITRRFCQKCRLEKCFSIGMVKESIMSDEDKAEKRRKIEINRFIKRKRVDSDDVVTSSKYLRTEHQDSVPLTGEASMRHLGSNNVQYDILNSTTTSPVPLRTEFVPASNIGQQPPLDYNQEVTTAESADYSNYEAYYPGRAEMKNQDPYGVVPDSRMFAERQSENTIRSILTSKPESSASETARHLHEGCDDAPSTSTDRNTNKARDILEDVERIPIEPNSIESILCEAIKLEFEAYGSVTHCRSSNRELNEVERAKLNELIVANKALHAPIEMDIASLVGNASEFRDSKHDQTLLSIINLTAVAIRRLIKMAKKINAFKNMCEEDQVALLKGGCTEMMVLRSTITYDCARNSWKIPHLSEEQSSIKTDVLKLAKGNVYHAHENFIRTFDPQWRTDENVILIMSAILLFTPDRPKAVHTDVIKLEQNSYYYLLRRYLESVYPGCEAKSIFLKLIRKIKELHRLAEEVIGVYLDVNPIDPLLMEIFDLKEHT